MPAIKCQKALIDCFTTVGGGLLHVLRGTAMKITSFETASGATHVVVAAGKGQYYGRFDKNGFRLHVLESGLGSVQCGERVRLSLLDVHGGDYKGRWISTPVTTIWVASAPTDVMTRMVAAYAELMSAPKPARHLSAVKP